MRCLVVTGQAQRAGDRGPVVARVTVPATTNLGSQTRGRGAVAVSVSALASGEAAALVGADAVAVEVVA